MKNNNKLLIRKAHQIRKKKFYALLMFFLFLPFGGFVVKLFGSTELSKLLIPLYLITLLILCFKVSLSQCPNCFRRFFISSFSANFFTNKCLNCGFSIKKNDLAKGDENRE